MRNFFLVLLLINILAYVYQSWIIEPDNSVAADSMSQDVPELLLALREQPEPEQAPAAGSDADYRCLRIGPLPQEADAEAVRRALQRKRATVRQTSEEGRVWVGYWVQTSGQGSRSAAEKTRDSLINNGMPDVYILPDDDFRISLGVFRLRSSADNIVRQALQMGFDTRVVERYQPGTNFWLLVRIPAEQTLNAVDLPSVPGQILRTESVACSSTGI